MPSISPIVSATARYISPLFIGMLLACPLYGITIGQTIWYFRWSKGDSIYLKTLITILLIVDGSQTIGLAQCTYAAYLRATRILDVTIPEGMIVDLYFSSFTVVLAHVAFTYRVWILSNRRFPIIIVLALLATVRFAASMGLTITEQQVNNALELHDRATDIFSLTEMVTSAVCDMLIAAAMAYYLHQWRSGFVRTGNLLDQLIMYIIGIGVLTSLFTVVILISWITMQQSLVFMIFQSVMSKLYVNSFLVTLNARRRLRSDIDQTDTTGPQSMQTSRTQPLSISVPQFHSTG